jgi:hypothetical protein
MDQNAREYELTKQVSLVLHDPLSLIALKETADALSSCPRHCSTWTIPVTTCGASRA